MVSKCPTGDMPCMAGFDTLELWVSNQKSHMTSHNYDRLYIIYTVFVAQGVTCYISEMDDGTF